MPLLALGGPQGITGQDGSYLAELLLEKVGFVLQYIFEHGILCAGALLKRRGVQCC